MTMGPIGFAGTVIVDFGSCEDTLGRDWVQPPSKRGRNRTVAGAIDGRLRGQSEMCARDIPTTLVPPKGTMAASMVKRFTCRSSYTPAEQLVKQKFPAAP